MNMYFIALLLPGELNDRILAMKRMMHEKYGCAVGLRSPAHITIIPPFRLAPESESWLLQDLDNLKNRRPFTITTERFGHFAERTIFIEPSLPPQLIQLKKDAEDLFCNEKYGIGKEARDFHPHITIATRDLHRKDFREAWAYFSSKRFTASWEARGISLLRHNQKNWDVIHTSQFEVLSME